MRDPMRIVRILFKLRSVWITYPDLRLGQLICNLASCGSVLDPFNVEDDVVEKKLDEVLKNGWK